LERLTSKGDCQQATFFTHQQQDGRSPGRWLLDNNLLTQSKEMMD
jgi:hypothetical protein